MIVRFVILQQHCGVGCKKTPLLTNIELLRRYGDRKHASDYEHKEPHRDKCKWLGYRKISENGFHIRKFTIERFLVGDTAYKSVGDVY